MHIVAKGILWSVRGPFAVQRRNIGLLGNLETLKKPHSRKTAYLDLDWGVCFARKYG